MDMLQDKAHRKSTKKARIEHKNSTESALFYSKKEFFYDILRKKYEK